MSAFILMVTSGDTCNDQQISKGWILPDIHTISQPELNLWFLLFICNPKSWFKSCDIVFQLGRILFRGFALFCIFVTNTIYVIEVEMLEPVVLARYHKAQVRCQFQIYLHSIIMHVSVTADLNGKIFWLTNKMISLIPPSGGWLPSGRILLIMWQDNVKAKKWFEPRWHLFFSC